MTRRLVLLLIGLLMTTVGAAAQVRDDAPTARDPLVLARELLGYDGEFPILPPMPLHEIGAVQTFWVGKVGNATPVQVEATLIGASDTVYLWAEDGVPVPDDDLNLLAAQLGAALAALRSAQNYEPPTLLPGIGRLPNPLAELPLPDVDNDPHLNILFTTDLPDDRNAVFNFNDSLPAALVPGGYSNEREMLYVNTSPFPEVPLTDGLYFNTLLRGMYTYLMNVSVPGQAPWLTEALGQSLLVQLLETQPSAASLAAFLDAPDTSIVRTSTLTTANQVSGGHYLFLSYLFQRYGTGVYRDLFLLPGAGVEALDTAMRQRALIDPVSGAPITARAAFADFVIANLLNAAFGDGRYTHRTTQLEQGMRTPATEFDDLATATLDAQSVSQFGAAYYAYTAQTPTRVTVTFNGASASARLPMPFDRAPEDGYYWSGPGLNQDQALTRRFDLTNVDRATLTFDVWYALADQWHYGYAAVSTDDGATWTNLPVENAVMIDGQTPNRNGLAYGAGFTGISNPAGPRPFPIMGVIIADDGVTIGEVSAGGPADEAGVRAGDVVIGYDGALWPTAPNILGLLANYAPGDTLNLYVQRGEERIDIPVLLGAHPSRIVLPEPLWVPHEIDLTPYAGGEILLRFQYVSVPGRDNLGFAIDNIAIPEIEFSDDASSDAIIGEEWTREGWLRVDNRVSQRWSVQAVTTGTRTELPAVRALIGVDELTTSGEWEFALGQGESLVVAVAALNDDTEQRAAFDIAFSERAP